MHVKFSHSICDLEFYNLGTNCMKDHVPFSALNLVFHVIPLLLSLTIHPS